MGNGPCLPQNYVPNMKITLPELFSHAMFPPFSEILAKPLVVLMGPYSGGKSTMINYLLGTEFTPSAFRAAAEPSPGFNFNIAVHGEVEVWGNNRLF